jgi:hypothetical protein
MFFEWQVLKAHYQAVERSHEVLDSVTTIQAGHARTHGKIKDVI